MIPVGRIEWGWSPEGLSFGDLPPEIDDASAELVYLQVALLNHCRKIEGLHRDHPLLAPLSDELIGAVRTFRPSFRLQPVDPAALLWSTRCFRLRTDTGPPEPVAIPVVDLLDHHARGAAGTGNLDTFNVPISRPLGDDTCFLDYGWRRDAIGMAVVYGFADRSAQIAHSAPMRIEDGTFGCIEIRGVGRDTNGHLVPMRAETTPAGITISQVSFGVDRDPVDELMVAAGLSRAVACQVIDAVAAVNLDLLDELSQLGDDEAGVAAATLVAAAAHQATVIRTYLEHVGDRSLT
jgi:hypothetical protein